MALNNTTADALAVQINTALGIVDAVSIAKTKAQWRVIYAQLKIDIQTQISALSIVTTGTAATQSGPPSPIIINPL